MFVGDGDVALGAYDADATEGTREGNAALAVHDDRRARVERRERSEPGRTRIRVERRELLLDGDTELLGNRTRRCRGAIRRTSW